MGGKKLRTHSRKIRGLCVECNKNMQESNGRIDGQQVYKPRCGTCSDNRNKPTRSYRKHKKKQCEKCGFIPKNKCQLDVDHIDGNHSNNDIDNLQTLCANCHRLKTHKDRLKKKAGLN